jgi:hypothetical protein
MDVGSTKDLKPESLTEVSRKARGFLESRYDNAPR